MSLADLLNKPVQFGSALAEPFQGFLADGIVLGVAGFDVGFVQRVEPGSIPLLVARPSFSELPVLFFSQSSQESQLV